MKIRFLTAGDMVILGIHMPKESDEEGFILKLASHLGRRSKSGGQIIANLPFVKDKVLVGKLVGFFSRQQGEALSRLNSFLDSIPDGVHMFILPEADDYKPNGERLVALSVTLVHLDTGKPIEELRKSFSAHQDAVGKYFDIISVCDSDHHKIFFGHERMDERICRWCGKSTKDPGTTFSNVAHAISEFLGNKRLFLNDECDQCNGKVINRLEGSLVSYLGPLCTLLSVRGKKGFRSHSESGVLATVTSPGQVVLQITSDKVQQSDKDGGLTMKFAMKGGNVVMQDIYKLLAKFALSVLSTEEFCKGDFKNTCRWISSCGYLDAGLPLVASCVGKRRSSINPRVCVYRRKSAVKGARIPEYLCELEIVATRYLFEIPLIHKSAVLDTAEKWKSFLEEVGIFGGSDVYSFFDFSNDKRVAFENNIVLAASQRGAIAE